MTDCVLTEERDDVLVITLNRPEARNAVNEAVAEAVAAALDELDRRADLSVGIITGAAPSFCAGMDLKAFLAGERPSVPGRGFAGIVERPPDKPMIAAVEGHAIAGGFEIALACDLIIASENATFALPEPRVGLAALAGGLHRLPRQIGLKRAMGMILTARHVSAREGVELGFVNEVVPAGEALAAAERWAETICKNSPMSIRASKQTIQKGLGVSLEQAMTEQRDYPAVKAMAASQDFVEGPKAFAEKRPPKWLGK